METWCGLGEKVMMLLGELGKKLGGRKIQGGKAAGARAVNNGGGKQFSRPRPITGRGVAASPSPC